MQSGHSEGWFVAPTGDRETLERDGIVPQPEFDAGELWLFDGLSHDHSPHITDNANLCFVGAIAPQRIRLERSV